MKRLQQFLFVAFLVACPIIYDTTGLSLRVAQERYYELMGMCLVATFIGNIWIALFIMLSVFLFLYNGAIVGQQEVFNIFLGGLIFMVSRKFFSVNKSEDYLKFLVWVAIGSITWMAFQYLKIDPIFTGQDAGGNVVNLPFNNPVGFFGIKMANGIFLCLVAPILASVNIWLVPLLLIPIWKSEASVVILAFASGMAFYIWMLYRRIFIPLMAVAILAVGAYMVVDERTDGQTFISRFPVWHSAVKFSFQNPLGYGPDSYRNTNKHKNFIFKSDEKYQHGVEFYLPKNEVQFHYYSMTNDRSEVSSKTAEKVKAWKPEDFCLWDNPHNEYIQLFFEFGLLGLILLFGLIREIWSRFHFAANNFDQEIVVAVSMLIVFAVAGLTQFPLHLARLGYLFPVILGLFYARTDESFA